MGQDRRLLDTIARMGELIERLSYETDYLFEAVTTLTSRAGADYKGLQRQIDQLRGEMIHRDHLKP